MLTFTGSNWGEVGRLWAKAPRTESVVWDLERSRVEVWQLPRCSGWNKACIYRHGPPDTAMPGDELYIEDGALRIKRR